MAFPIKITDLYKLSKRFGAAQQKKLRLTIYIDPRCPDKLVEDVCELLRPATGRTQVFVRVLSGQRGTDAAQLALGEKSAVRVLLCAHSADLAGLAPFPPQTCVVTSDELRSCGAQALGLSILDVISPLSGDIEAQLAVWLSVALASRRLTVAGDFPFTRAEISRDICSATARQNAVIALVPFTRGADMPVLVANQTKMLFQLALVRGLKLTPRRIPELLATGAVALAGRGLAQRTAPRIAPLRWLARGAVAYGLTMALGQGAGLYYERQAQKENEQAALAALDSAEQHLEAAGLANPTETLRGLLTEAAAARK
ncbi:MAG: hypothetical protein FWD65_03010 [Coriobacteriia bacterium]|nr:hypothetical protein [Coriobacteriia bacterium]